MFSTIKELLGPCPKCQAANFSHSKTSHDKSKDIINRNYSSQTHYDVLGINRSATTEEIKAAFVKESKLAHPDKSLHADSASHDKFVRLNEAYMVLSKPSTRREYDVSMIANWNREQDLRRYQHQGQSAGSNSMRSGTGFNNVGADDRIFWDETLYHMRDKSKDGSYKNRPYYGVNGMKKLPNSYIVYACLGLVFSGVILHFVALSHSRNMNARVLDVRDRKNNRHYLKSKENAKVHGTALQLEILKSRVEEHPRSAFRPSIPPKK